MTDLSGTTNGGEPLQRYRRVRTRDVEEFGSTLSTYLARHRLYPLSRGARVDARVSAVSLGAVSLLYARHRGGELGAEMTDRISRYSIQLPLDGHNVVTSGGERVVVEGRRGGILSPTMSAGLMLSADYHRLNVLIERAAMQRHLEGLVGHPVAGPVRFDLAMDLSRPAAVTWTSMACALVRDLDRGDGLAAHPLAVAGFSELMMTGLLLAQRHDHSELLEEPNSRRSPRTVTRAVDFIEQSLDQPIGLSEIAAATGVGARSLQRDFRECVGLSPLAYLQQRRLARVHEELRDAAPGSGVTVTDTALRWGFAHLPRFAAAYRARYGVAPSETLRYGEI